MFPFPCHRTIARLTTLFAMLGILCLSRASHAQGADARRDSASIRATTRASQLGLTLRDEQDGRLIEFQRFDPSGFPLYYVTSNSGAAATISSNKVYPGGGAGLSLTGSGVTLGEWDGGAVRITHQELTGRVTQVDGASSNSAHATHVAGTLIASGVVASAKGMSYAGTLSAYDWNSDQTEMSTAAGLGLKVSNHSYGLVTGWINGNFGAGNGWYWFGDPAISTTQDYYFGFYDTEAQAIDNIAVSNPNYLICRAAGNDRGEGPAAGTTHYVWNGSAWVSSTATRNIDGNATGYDCIGHENVAKNMLTVGAVNGITNGYTQPSDVVMSSFSCWGPADDGRIKPDIVAKGVGTYSSVSTNNTSYASYNGTSMATPNAAGSVGLLLHHQQNLHPGTPLRSSTMKGLIIHTADEAGAAAGPDYKFGWGLMNTRKAADVMTLHSTSPIHMYEQTLNQSATISLPFTSDGTPFRATICWTDPAGTPPAAALNPTTKMLVNDLDLRVLGPSSTTYFPYVLNPASPASAATTADNNTDNVEVVHIAAPTNGGLYTLQVTHKGTLTGGAQIVSIIITGNNACTAPGVTLHPLSQSACTGATASFTSTASGTPTPTVQWQESTNGGTSWSDITGATSTTYAFTAAPALNNNQYRAVFTGGCGTGTVTSNAATLTTGTLTSSATGNWNAPSTWTPNCVPGAEDDVTIATPVTLTADASCADLNISGVGTLNLGVYSLNVGGDWQNGGGSFVPGTGTVVFNGSAAQSITKSGGETFANFTVNKPGGSLTLNSPATVNGVLTLAGGTVATTGTNRLTIGSVGSVSGGSATSFVDGPMTHTVASAASTTKTFPIGKGAAYRPIDLTVTQAAASSTTYTAEQFNSAPPGRTLPGGIALVSTVRYFTVTRGWGSSISQGAITFHYGPDDGVTSASSLRIAKDDGAGAWIDLGGTGTGTPSGSIASTVNFTSFSDFVLASADNNNALPVQLAAFSAGMRHRTVLLRWTTATETNNHGFDIERSIRDAAAVPSGAWEKIGFIAGQGTTNTRHEYRFTDLLDARALTSPALLYRLKQIDRDASVHYSRIVEVNPAAPSQALLGQNYPNPFGGGSPAASPLTTMAFSVASPSDVVIDVYDELGRKVARLVNESLLPGTYSATFDGSSLQGGVYFCRMSVTSGNKTLILPVRTMTLLR